MAGNKKRDDITYREWKPLPPRASAWSSLSSYERLVGLDLFRVFGEEEVGVAEDWKLMVARRLEFDGRDRPPLYRALDAMVAAGFLLIEDGTMRLLYSDAARAARRRHIGSTSAPGPHHDGCTSVPRSTHVGVTSTARPTQVEGRSVPRSDPSGGNRSGPDPQIDREIDREKEREIKSAHAREGLDEVPSDGPAVGLLRNQIKLGYEQRLWTKTAATPPKTLAVEQALSAVTRWVHETAGARRENSLELANRLLTAFFAHPKAVDNGFKLTWLANDPMEFLSQRASGNRRGMAPVSSAEDLNEPEPEFMQR